MLLHYTPVHMQVNSTRHRKCFAISAGTNWITLRENEEKGLGTKKWLPKLQWPVSVRGKQNESRLPDGTA